MAKNEIYAKSSPLRIAVASTVNSGDPVLFGALSGVAITDYDADDSKATVSFDGVYDLSVKGVNGAGDVAVAAGDALYYVTGDTPKLSKKSLGTFFGYAMEAVVSGATTTIRVLLARGGAALDYGQLGLSISDEATGTGSGQNVAHGLGVAPSKVVAILTEFASNLSVDVAEGTHTSTNAVVTVTSGAKFRILAIR